MAVYEDTEGNKYISTFSGVMIDTLLSWAKDNRNVNIVEFKAAIENAVSVATNKAQTAINTASNAANIANNALSVANSTDTKVNELSTIIDGIQITRTVASDGLYIGIKVNGVTVHTEVIQPITFNGLNATGKNARYGIVDRDFVNDLKAWVKLCVNDKLPEAEGFKADWNKDFKQAEADFQQQIKTQDEKIQGLEVYKELFDTGKKEV